MAGAILIMMSMATSMVLPFTSSKAAPALLTPSPAHGDLDIFSLGYHSSSSLTPSSTVLLLVDPSVYLNGESPKQIRQLQQSLQYLMDTPGLMADNLQLGIAKVNTQSASQGIPELALVAAQPLGPAANSHHPESQRYKIKRFLIDHCPQFPNCEVAETVNTKPSSNSAMAYALAAAYMMGTETHNPMANLSVSALGSSNQQNTNQQGTELAAKLKGTDNLANAASDYPLPIHSTPLTAAVSLKPRYNQCSVKHFTDIDNSAVRDNQTAQSTGLDYRLGNSIIIINSDLPSVARVTSATTENATSDQDSLIDPLAMMTQSLLPKQLSSTLNNPLFEAYQMPEPCRPQQEISAVVNDISEDLSNYCQLQYARHLNQFNSTRPQLNPSSLSLQTGVISFVATGQSIDYNGFSKDLPNYDCLTTSGVTKQNCQLGQYGQAYGEGGYLQLLSSAQPTQSAQSESKALAQAVLVMVNNLAPQSAALTMTDPMQLTNPMRRGQVLLEGYLPFIQPQFGSLKAQWPGGVRKYKHSADGFKDKKERLIANKQQAVTAIIDAESNDLWSKRISGAIDAPNFRQPFPLGFSPVVDDLATQSRNVYLSQSQPGPLMVQSRQSLTNLELDNFSDLEQLELRKLLLSYMTENVKPGGGVYHSKPIALISKAILTKGKSVAPNLTEPKDPEGLIEDSNSTQSVISPSLRYKKHIMFGAMDNALHIIDDETGEEIAAVFFQQVLAEKGQFKAITNRTIAKADEAIPSFGLDSAWTQYARYVSESNGDKVAKQLYVFGGARLGAKAYYGLNLTGLDKVVSAGNLNGFVPQLLFSITADRQDFGGNYYKRLGYSWGKPVITYINWFGKPTLVAILSGGYDASEYDKPDGLRELHYLQQGEQSTLGNAIYIVDAKTGEPLIVATGTGDTLNSNPTRIDSKGFSLLSKGTAKVLQVANGSLAYSITGPVQAMDREGDTLTDHLYFADLEGQLFRLDIDNVASSADLASRVRVVRLADFRVNNKLPGPRFYQTPVVTIQKYKAENDPATKFATVTLASGDRSHPLRISDPSNQTVGVEIAFEDNLGNRQLMQAVRKAYISQQTDYAELKLDTTSTATSTDWQIDYSNLAIDFEPLSQVIQFNGGQFKLSSRLIRAGSQITASTTFSSTDKITASKIMPHVTRSNFTGANNQANSLSPLQDPLAPNISVADDWVTITPVTTAELSALSRAPNHVYTLYDKDVATANLFNTATPKLQTQNISLTEEAFPEITQIDVANPHQTGYHKKGWRAALTQFTPVDFAASEIEAQQNEEANAAGKNNEVSHSIKAFGPMFALNNKAYLTAYNPDPKSTPLVNCRPQLIGSTEVYQFCLPYGNCNTQDKKFHTPIQRIGYGSGMTALSWKTDHTGQSKRLFTTSQPATGPSKSFLELNDISRAPKFVNTFTLKPQLRFVQWFDYSNHSAVSN